MSGIFAILEDIDNNGSQSEEEIDLQLAETTSDEVAADGDIATDVTQVQNDVKTTDAAFSDSEELEAISDTVEKNGDKGEEISDNAVEITAIAIERAYLRLGLSSTAVKANIASLEAADHKDKRKWILESIGSTLARIWESIAAMARRIWEGIKSIIAGLFQSVKILETKIKLIKEKIPLLTNKETDGKMTVLNLHRAISVEGKADFNSYMTLHTNAKKLADMVPAITENYAKLTELAEKSTETPLDEYKSKSENYQTSFINNIIARAGFTDTPKTREPLKPAGGLNVADEAYGPFVGNYIFSIRTTGLFQRDFNIEKGIAPASMGEVKVLTPAQMGEVLKAAEDILGKFKELKTAEKNFAKTKASIEKTAKKFTNNIKAEGEYKETLKQLKRDVRAAINANNFFGLIVPRLVFNTARAGLDYITISMSTYRTKAA